MTREEIEKRRHLSKSGDKGPWADHWEAMASKTVLREPIVRGLISIDQPAIETEAGDTARRVDFSDLLEGEVQTVSVQPTVPSKSAKAKSPAKAPPLDPEALSADLASCTNEGQVEDLRTTYIKGASAPEAETIKAYCVDRVKQLMSANETGELFEKSANAAEE
jgi:recombination protein RecT